MANFQYIARTTTGDRVTGIIEAGSESAASRLLGEQQLFPVRVREQAEAKSVARGHRIKSRETAAFYEQLADLLRAGVPMLRALDTIIDTCGNPRIASVVRDLRDRVAAGKALHEAMAEQPAVFNTLQIAMVRAGERGGFLEQVLVDLATYLERQDELRGRVLGAMIYPALLTFVGIAIVLLFLIWLVPQFKVLFANIDLPFASRVLFAASDLLHAYWPITVTAVFTLVVAGTLWWKSDIGKTVTHRLLLKTPVIGRTLIMVSLTRFCRILGTMLASGVPILQALAIGRDATGLPVLARTTDKAIESVRGGQGLTPPLRECGVIPQQIVAMIAVAEESNQLEKTLLKVADTVEVRTNRQVDMAVRLIEPFILVLLAGTILFVALGLLFPIFTMARSIH